eukprot:PhF_6_TR31426/c0_g1_i3/m.46086
MQAMVGFQGDNTGWDLGTVLSSLESKHLNLRQDIQALTHTQEKLAALKQQQNTTTSTETRGVIPWMVPLAGSTYAFVQGKISNVDEVTVLLGDSWFVKRSNAQAIGIAQRRVNYLQDKVKEVEDDVAKVRKELQVLERQQSSLNDVDDDELEEVSHSTKQPTKSVDEIFDMFTALEDEYGEDMTEDQIDAVMKKKHEQPGRGPVKRPKSPERNPHGLQPNFEGLVKFAANHEKQKQQSSVVPKASSPPRDLPKPDFASLIRLSAPGQPQQPITTPGPPSVVQAQASQQMPEVQPPTNVMRPKLIVRSTQPVRKT